jgi:heterodisulfide reductase subunit B
MQLSYFPGCSAEGTGVEFDLSARAVCAELGLELVDLPEWNCCGATSAHAVDDRLAVALAARNLALAEAAGRDLVVSCAACFQRLRAAAHRLTGTGPAVPAGVPAFEGRIAVRHLLDVLAAEPQLSTLRARRPAAPGRLPVVPYYGCLVVRPPAVTGAPDAEDPTSMDLVLDALGADVRPWPYKTRCCGASLSFARPDVVAALCAELLAMARRAGAEAIVVSCPLCFMNLDRHPRATGEAPVPVLYFTELAGLALGLRGARRCLRRHLVDPRPVLAARGVR